MLGKYVNKVQNFHILPENESIAKYMLIQYL